MEIVIGAVAVVVTVLTWAFSQWADRWGRRAAHTADFLSALSTNDLLAEANYRMSILVQAGSQLEDSSIDNDTRKYVQRLLNYYEYIASFYYFGVLNKGMVKKQRGRAMARAYWVCKTYIKARRERLQAPTLYESLQRFVEEEMTSPNPSDKKSGTSPITS